MTYEVFTDQHSKVSEAFYTQVIAPWRVRAWPADEKAELELLALCRENGWLHEKLLGTNLMAARLERIGKLADFWIECGYDECEQRQSLEAALADQPEPWWKD